MELAEANYFLARAEQRRCADASKLHRGKALRPPSGCRTVKFSAAPLLHPPIAKKVAGSRHGAGTGLAVGKLPPLRLSRDARLPMADCALADRLRGHLGHSALPAETVELLSRRGHPADLRRPYDSSHDLVPAACSVLLDLLVTTGKPLQTMLSLASTKLYDGRASIFR